MKNVKGKMLIVVGAVLIITLAIFIGYNQRMTTGKTVAQKGNQIALMIAPIGKPGNNLFVLDLESGEAIQLTQGEKTRIASWSPDGERIAIVYGKWQDLDLYILDVDTGDTQKLVSNSEDLYQVVWSPDGQQLAYLSNGITIVDPDGNPAHGYGLVRASGGYDWSPDGKKIIYIAKDDPEDPRSPSSIHVIDADGSNPPEILLSFDGLEKAPQWSPDGSRILFKVETTHDQWGGVLEEALYVANVDGKDVTEIAKPVARGVPVYWSPDGSQILFEDIDAQICRYHVETGEMECNFSGFYPVWDLRGEQIAYINFDWQICVSAGQTTGRCYDAPEKGPIYILGWQP